MNGKLPTLVSMAAAFVILSVADVGRAQAVCESLNPCTIVCDLVDECSNQTIAAPEGQDLEIFFFTATEAVTVVAAPGFTVTASIDATLTDSDLPDLDVSVFPATTVTDNVFRGSTVQFGNAVTFDGSDFVAATLVASQSAIDSSSFANATFDSSTVFPAGFGDPILRGMIDVTPPAAVPTGIPAALTLAALLFTTGFWSLRATAQRASSPPS